MTLPREHCQLFLGFFFFFPLFRPTAHDRYDGPGAPGFPGETFYRGSGRRKFTRPQYLERQMELPGKETPRLSVLLRAHPPPPPREGLAAVASGSVTGDPADHQSHIFSFGEKTKRPAEERWYCPLAAGGV